MKAHVIIAEAASVHPDGTFSLLRGNINRQRTATFPTVFEGAVAVRIVCDPAESGPHSLRLVVVNQDGGELSRFELAFVVPEGGGASMLGLRTRQLFPAAGVYSFRVAVDGHALDDETFVVELVEPTEPTRGPAGGGA